MTNQRVEKWERWLKGGIQNDAHRMHLQRFAWKRMVQIATENPEVKDVVSYFWDFQFDLYIKTQAGAVRRQADVNVQVASLGQLLSEIAKTPALLTRDWYLGHWGAGEEDEGERQYWERAGRRVWGETTPGRPANTSIHPLWKPT